MFGSSMLPLRRAIGHRIHGHNLRGGPRKFNRWEVTVSETLIHGEW